MKPEAKSITPQGARAPRGDLTPKQHRALMALLESPTAAEAAKKAGCNEQTLGKWLRQPAFRDALAAARREAMKGVLGRLQVVAIEAVEVLRDTLKDPNVFARLQGAQTLLGHATRATAVEEMESRLEAVEAALRRSNTNNEQLN